MKESYALERLVRGLVVVLLATAVQLTAQNGNDPEFETGGFGEDGTCIDSGYGMGPVSIGGWIAYAITQSGGQEPPTEPTGPITQEPTNGGNDVSIPSPEGNTVALDGGHQYSFMLTAPPSLVGPMAKYSLILRSRTTGTAMPGFDPSLHFSGVDEATVVLENGVPVSITWVTGSGDVHVADVEIQQPASPQSGITNERWFRTGGRAFSRFRTYDYSGQTWLERYRRDGGVMRYEESGAKWRPSSFFDRADNEYVYHWRTDGRLDKIVDPRGVETRFVWTINDPCTAVGSIVEIEYHKGATHFSSLDTTIELDCSKRLSSLTAPQTTYYEVGSDPLLDLTAPVTDARKLEFTYYASGHAHAGSLENITDSRASSAVVRHHEWGWFRGNRVLESVSDEHGVTHDFAYYLINTTDSRVVYQAQGTADMGTSFQFDFGNTANGAPWLPDELTLIPHSSTGLPRTENEADPNSHEPTSLKWEFTWSACSCGLPLSVKYPSGATYSMTYDAFGRRTSFTQPSPAGTGNVTFSWTYEGLSRATRPLTFSGPTETASLQWNYNWTSRSSLLYGDKLDDDASTPAVEIVSSSISVVGGGSHTLEMRYWVDSLGRLVKTEDVGGTEYLFSYAAQGSSGELLLSVISRSPISNDQAKAVEFDFDDIGFLQSLKTGTTGHQATYSLTLDGLGRVSEVSVVPSSGAAALVTKIRRDRFENVAVVQRKNLDHTGQLPATGARAWLRNEWHYDFGRLTDAYVDRRDVRLAESLSDPTGGSDPWMLHYQYAYDELGGPDTVTRPNGAIDAIQVDGYGLLYRVIRDQGGLNVESPRLYFDDDLVLRERRVLLDNAGGTPTYATTTFARNGGGWGPIHKITDAEGLTAEFTFDVMGRATKTEHYKTAGSVLRRVEADYDDAGRVYEVRREYLEATGQEYADYTVKYDVRGNPLEVVSGSSVTSSIDRKLIREFDGYGRLTHVRDGLNTDPTKSNETEIVYKSGLDLVEKRISKFFDESDDSAPPAGTRSDYVTEYDHDLLGRVTSRDVKGLGGAQTALTHTYGYDSLGRTTFYQAPDQQQSADLFSQTTFDAVGRWVEFVRSKGADPVADKIVLETAYLDRQSGTTQVAVERRDGRDRLTKHVYDAAFRLTDVYKPGFTSGQAHHTSITYDLASRVDTMIDGNSSAVSHTYDDVGRLLTRAAVPGAGVSLLATKETFTYDDLGRRESMRTDQGTAQNILMVESTMTYDSLDRVLDESFEYYLVDDPVSVASTWDFTGGGSIGDPYFRRGLTYSSGFERTVSPDAVGRVDTVDLQPPSAGSSYPLANYRWGGSQAIHRTVQLGAGSHTIDRVATFDGYRRIETLKSTLDDGLGTTTDFDDRTFAWDDAGMLLKREFDKQVGEGDLFDYDPFRRLTEAKLGLTDISDPTQGQQNKIDYDHDAAQNRKSVTESLTSQTTNYTTEANSNRYYAVGTISPSYDGEGNLVFDGRFYLVYDFKNRLSEVWELTTQGTGSAQSGTSVSTKELESGRQEVVGKTMKHGMELAEACADCTKQELTASGLQQSSGGTASLTLVAVYGYDPMNRRVLRMVTSELDQRFAYDGWREVEELEPTVQGQKTVAVAQKAFVWGAGHDELLAYYQKDTAWEGYFATQNEQRSVVALHDDAGVLTEKLEYSPYGKRSVYPGGSGTAQSNSTVDNPYGYHGLRFDYETGFVYSRNRYLDTEWGRFLTVDPLGSWADGANLGNAYGFVGNGATLATDPSGLMSVASGGGFGGFGGGGWTYPQPGPPGPPPGSGPSAGGSTSGVDCQDPVRIWVAAHKREVSGEERIYFEFEGQDGKPEFFDVTPWLDGAGEATPSLDANQDTSGFMPDGSPYLSASDLADALDAGPTSLPSDDSTADIVLAGLGFVPIPGARIAMVGARVFMWASRVVKFRRAASFCTRAASWCQRVATRAVDLGPGNKKLDFFLGRATGGRHNIDRSTTMLAQLRSIGLPDRESTRKLLVEHLTEVGLSTTNIVGVNVDNGRTTRESLLKGPYGLLKVETVWDGNKLITGKFFGGRSW